MQKGMVLWFSHFGMFLNNYNPSALHKSIRFASMAHDHRREMNGLPLI